MTNCSPKSILIIDDDARLCHLIAAALTERGFNVYCASNSLEVRNYLSRCHEIGIILCDRHLGDESGIKILKKARKANPNMLLAGMSGRPDSEAEFIAVGAAKFFPKPFPISDLVEWICLTMRPKQ